MVGRNENAMTAAVKDTDAFATMLFFCVKASIRSEKKHVGENAPLNFEKLPAHIRRSTAFIRLNVQSAAAARRVQWVSLCRVERPGNWASSPQRGTAKGKRLRMLAALPV